MLYSLYIYTAEIDCDTQIVFLKYLFEILIFKRVSRQQKSMKNYPAGKDLTTINKEKRTFLESTVQNKILLFCKHNHCTLFCNKYFIHCSAYIKASYLCTLISSHRSS